MFIPLSRTAAALLGGYAFTWGFTAFGITCLLVFGMDFHEAETAVMLVAFLVFLWMFLWAFAAASVRRVWAVMLASTAAMSGAAWMLQRFLLA